MMLALGSVALTILSALYLTAQGDTERMLAVPDSEIIFLHKFHVEEAEVECTACHPEIESSTKSSDRNFPTMDQCAACHDVEDDTKCGICHRNAEEPGPIPTSTRPIAFNHKTHLSGGIKCLVCHNDVAGTEKPESQSMPTMAICMDCHDGVKANKDCELCHQKKVTLADIHPEGWRHKHAERASTDRQWCLQCHREESACLACHRGDNLTGTIHDLNYQYTHGLDARSKNADCARCHDTKGFCADCHDRGNRMPLNHSALSWVTDHGRFARNDVENCASCHDNGDPTCARSGCHTDFDGIKGTNPRIHDSGISRFDSHGPWHDDDGYFCFQCHTSTHTQGEGFCGYCHS